jgi:hypothetical protein
LRDLMFDSDLCLFLSLLPTAFPSVCFRTVLSFCRRCSLALKMDVNQINPATPMHRTTDMRARLTNWEPYFYITARPPPNLSPLRRSVCAQRQCRGGRDKFSSSQDKNKSDSGLLRATAKYDPGRTSFLRFTLHRIFPSSVSYKRKKQAQARAQPSVLVLNKGQRKGSERNVCPH